MSTSDTTTTEKTVVVKNKTIWAPIGQWMRNEIKFVIIILVVLILTPMALTTVLTMTHTDGPSSTEISAAKRDAKSARAANENLQSQLDDANSDKESDQRQLKDSADKIADLRKQLNAAKSDLATTQSKADGLQGDNDQLKRDNEALKARDAQLVAQLSQPAAPGQETQQGVQPVPQAPTVQPTDNNQVVENGPGSATVDSSLHFSGLRSQVPTWKPRLPMDITVMHIYKGGPRPEDPIYVSVNGSPWAPAAQVQVTPNQNFGHGAYVSDENGIVHAANVAQQ